VAVPAAAVAARVEAVSAAVVAAASAVAKFSANQNKKRGPFGPRFCFYSSRNFRTISATP
jgi:hypothetical protein